MILCADDYGLREDVDDAIVELAASRRLSAVSCMVALSRCTPTVLSRLREYQARLDVGLHLCLTDEGLPWSPLPPWPGDSRAFRWLLQQALLGRVGAEEILPQIAAQYQLFVEKCGRKPDFIDGHLYVHQLPGVREALLKFLLNLSAEARPYIRNTHLPPGRLWSQRLPWLKAALIGAFGATFLKRLRAAGVQTNDGYAGIYDFQHWRNYPRYLPRFVACLPNPNGMLVVHPGSAEAWRRQEFEELRRYPFPLGQPHRFQKAQLGPGTNQ